LINKLNEKFAKPAAREQDAHSALLPEDNLKQILCWEYDRQVQNDWTIQFETQYYQIKKSTSINIRAKQKIKVRRHLDDSISLWYKDQKLSFKILDKKPKKVKEKKSQTFTSADRAKLSRANKHKSPWSQYKPKLGQIKKTAEENTLRF